MKYRITKIEMKDENSVVVYLKLADREGFTAPSFEDAMKDPFRLVELSKQIGNAYVSSIADDAYVTLDYSEYCELELKVGDFVELELKPLGT
ncbi:MAG: hypothetical protein DSY33_01880 [Archaeoglobus sp.]|jgi:hypothetical protein|nr:MAG: hypothetical protein DSY33_01880 [Archaeoglobus sp.]